MFGNAYILRKDDFIFYLQKQHNSPELTKNGILYNGFAPICDHLTAIQFIIRSRGGHIWRIYYENVQEVHEIFENFAVSYRKIQTMNKKREHLRRKTMSKLKSALLIGVVLSPIFVSATRGIEVVHAEVVQNAVAQQVKKATEVKPVKGTDEKKTDDKKVDTVTAASQGDSDIDNTRSEKPNIIAFSDKDFLQKFKATNYYQQQVAMYGENKPGADAALAAQGASYLSSIIGEAFIKAESKPTIMKALGFAGPIGALLGCLIDWLTPSGRNTTNDKLKEIDQKLDDLGVHINDAGNAIINKINEKSVDDKIQTFTGELEKTNTNFGTVTGELRQYQEGHQITLDSKNPVHVQKFVDEYAKLYHTSEWGFDAKDQKAKQVPNSWDFQTFNDLCDLGRAIVSGNVDQNNIFRVMSNYESLKEFFNTQTFATREAFADYVMSHYTVWASNMMTAIFFDYFRAKGKLDLITASDEYKESVAAAKTNGTSIDDEFQKRYPISFQLYDGLRSNARDDLMRLGYDVGSDNGHNNSYDLDEYDKNHWVDKYNNKSVYINSDKTNILGANVNAVNYTYATEIENEPVYGWSSELSGEDQNRLAAAEKAAKDAQKAYDDAVNKSRHDFSFPVEEVIKAREAKSKADNALMRLQLELKAKSKQPTVLKDENGSPLPGKLTAEEKVSDDGKMLYSYRTNNWVYSQLVTGPAAYAAKHMVGKNDLDAVLKMCGCKTNFYLCWENNTDLSDDPNWNKEYENAMSKGDIERLNTNASIRNKGGINSLLANTVTRVVNGVQMLGFKRLDSNRIIGDGDYIFTGDESGFLKLPTFNIGLGYYQNDKKTSPSTEQKTVYQNFSYDGTGYGKDGYYQSYHEKHYDQNDVTFIKLVKDGDSELGALNNGSKTPVAPEHFVE